MDTIPACYEISVINPNRIWQTQKVFKTELPLLAIQISFTVLMSRLFFIIYKPLHQTRLIAQISVGFLLTPELIGRYTSVFEFIFPARGVINIEVLAHIGLIYYAFLSGLEMNLNTILHVKKKAISIALAGIIFPLVLAPPLYELHRKFYENETALIHLEKESHSAFMVWTLVLTVTGFPVLAHTLSELKLIYTGLGRSALTAAMISDTYGWILFILMVPFSINGERAVFTVISTILFIIICVFVVRPIILRLIDHKNDKEEWDDDQILFVVMGLFACSYITDVLGTHSIVGAFVYGLILPHGRFADKVMSISDDFAGGFLAPLFFSGTGMRLLLASVFYKGHWPLTVLIILLLCTLKILSTLFATFFFGIFSVPTYVVLTTAVLTMTVVVSPVINAVYKTRKRFEQNKLKTIQKLRVDAELRILACVHNTRQASGMISLIESFNATRITPIHVFGLYLIELTGRAAALVAAHMDKPCIQPGEQNLTRSQAELESIANTFDSFGEAYDAVRIETLNVVSAYATIHEDIFNAATDKCTSLILLPFHKHLSSEAALEVTSVMYKDINQNVMQNAPCSVGIFVDRDFGSIPKVNLRVLMLFVGGPDDREALAVAWRMAGHPGIQLSVVRILLFNEAAEGDTPVHNKARGMLNAVMDGEKQRELDDEYVNSFRLKGVNSDDSISYSEIDVHNGEEIPTVLHELEKDGCDLYIVGQGNCRNSRVFSNLLEWCDCSELGVIGDILASNNFGSRSSVLVVQQYGYGGMVFGKNNNHMATNGNGFETLVVKTE